MKKNDLEKMVREVYPGVKIIQAKKLDRMKLRMSRTGAISWQKFKNVEMVETANSYYFDIRESLIRRQKQQLIAAAAVFVFSLVLALAGVSFAIFLLILPCFAFLVCPINIFLYRRPSRIVMIWKNRIEKSEMEGEEQVLSGVPIKGDACSIVADMKDQSASGTIGFRANFTVRFQA